MLTTVMTFIIENFDSTLVQESDRFREVTLTVEAVAVICI